jgi:uncharacterized metal-binding protein YceD (DUF177 family)
MMSAPITWAHDTDAITEYGLEVERVATAEERVELAKALELVACDRLETRYTIRPLANGQYLATGTVEAAVVQSCVVTLEPVNSRIVERFEVDFWPPEKLPEPGSGGFDVLAAPDCEPIEGGIIPIGRIVYEHVATALDPYPRKEGAEFRWRDPEDRPDDERRDSPFAVLAKLKPKG